MPLNWHGIKLLFQAGHVLSSRSTTGKIPALAEYSHLTSSYLQYVCKPYTRSLSLSPFLVHQ